ncbi:hypothetical protein [Clostridium gasigenes]|uniref:Uncharacterized protein n=1 Tax=Clostridium gasigenes TaxID=94869 RepID=A0A1H0R4B3_9CLOT|nr:hypothetical protein [Clostridium gasigenes]MBB6622923.1 hypothetical protein [Clostridium gasigenes]MBB6715051.1 hypothetical protein [Clostridium gasigenes]MBU3087693.1 hypothetical protein [Clostridium gasigenes]MBU3104002.1 hypothetical protein [Clostridium gasigenes]MBU3132395.1 hypothetical protein [Clostridium gasigenes]
MESESSSDMGTDGFDLKRLYFHKKSKTIKVEMGKNNSFLKLLLTTLLVYDA